MSVTWPSSNSSTETLVNESVRGNGKEKKRKKNVYNPCPSCERLIFDVFTSQLASEKTIASSRNFTNIHDLQISAKKCPMCRLLWLVLQGADDALLDQILKYSNDDFNTTGLYHPDGGTDIDELLDPGQKVKISITARLKLKNRPMKRFLPPSIDQRTDILSLQFDISYRTHAGAHGYATRTIHEDVPIFRNGGSICADETRSDIDELRKHILLLDLDQRLDSYRKWDLLASWLRQDPRSAPAYDPDSLPSRVLDLSREGQVCLVEGPRSSYAALSHRWGASQHFTTTSHTLDKLKQGVPLNLLPMTFRDAVSVTRQLGIFSLWIDALCIVQDDRADWERESRKMGDMFTNAKFVIAAHCAADDFQGFLAKALSKHDAIEFKVSRNCESVCVYRHGNFEVDVTNSALSKRGWVLQERFLATHTIHFTSHGVFSETPTKVLSEDGLLTPMWPRSVGATFFGPSSLPQLRTILTGGGVEIDEGTVHDLQIQRRTPLEWLTLVEMYTNCDLTREEDKLFAISGMARRMHLHTGNSWCAGLWSDQISEGLLWLPEHGLSYPTYPRAPSWSWAAWDGPIQYPITVQRSPFEPRAKFISVRETNPSSDSTENSWLDGPGTLQIQAKIISMENVILIDDCVQLGPGPDRRGYLTDNNRDFPRLYLKRYLTAYPLRGRRYTTKRRKVREDGLPPCGWVALDDHHFAQMGSDIRSDSFQNCCFALLGIHRTPSGGLIYLGVYLCPITDRDGQAVEYRRIGCGQLSHSFISGENLAYESWKPDELAWSTLSDDDCLYVPPDLSVLSVILIR